MQNLGYGTSDADADDDDAIIGVGHIAARVLKCRLACKDGDRTSV